MKNQKWTFYFATLILFQLFFTASSFAGDYNISDIALTPGADETQLNFNWHTDTATLDDDGNVIDVDACAVEISKKLDKHNKYFFKFFKFPKDSRIFEGTKASAGNDENGEADYFCEADVTGLKNNSEYFYRVGDGYGNWSDRYEYSTANRNSYGFVYLSDSQIGASAGRGASEADAADAIANDAEAWANTVAIINEEFPETAFILSAGDQIEHPAYESEWTGFFSPAELVSIPVAPAPGSHDELGTGTGGAPSSESFDYHFYLPNEGEHLEVYADLNNCPPDSADCTPDYQWRTLAAGDYYFTYGNALFMVLNMDSDDYDAHKAFMQAAVDANPRVKWKIAMWHYTIYTAATRGVKSGLREAMVPILEDLGVDVALMGHDHSYCRTYQMLNFEAQPDQFINNRGEVVNPTGILYMTANSASGSKYYSLDLVDAVDDDGNTIKIMNPEKTWVSAYDQSELPTFSYVGIHNNRLEIATYVIDVDAIEEIDTYSIVKIDPPEPRPPFRR